VKITIALAPDDIDNEGIYFCDLPTEVSTGMNLYVDANFHIESNRKSIHFDNAYNKKLFDFCANSVKDIVLRVLEANNGIPCIETARLIIQLLKPGFQHKENSEIYKAIENVSKIASPLAVVVLGGTFNFSQTKGMLKQVLFGTIGRVVVVPTITITTAILLTKYTNLINFDVTVYPAMIALFASPVAVSSAIMASQMDNDGELAGQYVVWTSLVSIVSIFIIVVILKSMMLL
jgi:hypothetical protein